MKAPFKYSGGKTREFPRIREFLPSNFNRTIEPFAGSAAVSFLIEKPAVLCDTRHNNIATFKAIANERDWIALKEWIAVMKQKSIEELNTYYYEQRDGMWNKCTTNLEYAKRWLTIRQLVFSGMDRINVKTGKFNAPFGWYKEFNTHLSDAHHLFLKQSTIIEGDFSQGIDVAIDGDFVFMDPPYLTRNSEYGGDSSADDMALHLRIFDKLNSCKVPWMMVHVDCPEYRQLYRDYNIHVKDFSYSQNFKGRDNTKSKVGHLYITNYS